MSNTCETCRWFDPHAGLPQRGWGECMLITDPRIDPDGSLLASVAGGDRPGRLNVSPDWGCIEHSPKIQSYPDDHKPTAEQLDKINKTWFKGFYQ